MDMDVLNQPDTKTMEQALARLSVEKRNQTERVKNFFDSNRKVPLEYNNLEYWTKVETVCSVMNINNGTGRHLPPVNFLTEIYLIFNLSPLHNLTGLIEGICLCII
jgi:hypothetical protein